MLEKLLKSFLLSLLLCLGGAFTVQDLPFKAVHCEPPFLCSRAEAAINMTFDEMYAGVSSLGITFSNKLKSAEGQTVQMAGFMAPPLTPTINFFVLTREPMSICPFCSTDADWPADIVVVQLDEPVVALPFDRPIMVTGTLELGTEVDAETGFVSLVRIQAQSLEAL